MPRKRKGEDEGGVAVGQAIAGAAVAVAGAALAAAPAVLKALRGGKAMPSQPTNARATRLAKRMAKKAAKRQQHSGGAA